MEWKYELSVRPANLTVDFLQTLLLYYVILSESEARKATAKCIFFFRTPEQVIVYNVRSWLAGLTKLKIAATATFSRAW